LDWLEFSVTADDEAAEAIVQLFNRYGQGGAVVEMPVDCFEDELPTTSPPAWVSVKTYLPLKGAEDQVKHLEEGLWHLRQIYPIAELDVRTLAEEDWAEAWKQQYHLLRIGERIAIVPAWEEYNPEPGEAVIRLEPGMAFGTGLHPTTRLCLEALEKHLSPGCTVLDVGTGSGVLAIAAAKLGARSVLALDTDPVAVAAARENVLQNQVDERIVVRQGSLSGDVDNRWGAMPSSTDSVHYLPRTGLFDLIVINILAPVIIGLAPALAARIQVGGQLIAAGLIESQEKAVVRALQVEALQVVERAEEQSWICVVVRRG
jgi:ribosomal protein L11 methyltransferase